MASQSTIPIKETLQYLTQCDDNSHQFHYDPHRQWIQTSLQQYSHLGHIDHEC